MKAAGKQALCCEQILPSTVSASTHSIHQASECWGLQHQGVEHLICLLSDVQQHCGEGAARINCKLQTHIVVHLNVRLF